MSTGARHGSAGALLVGAIAMGCASRPPVQQAAVGASNGAAWEARAAPVEAVAVTSRADGILLAGDLYLPAAASPAPAIVLLGPTGPDDRSLRFGRLEPFRALTEHLRAHGMAVLTLDDRGGGDSGGDWTRAGFGTLELDVRSALEWLAEHPRWTVPASACSGSRKGARSP